MNEGNINNIEGSSPEDVAIQINMKAIQMMTRKMAQGIHTTTGTAHLKMK